ncbi:MAG: PEP-CTERM sorting domain-containing protein [Phycisphaerae bacterium]
MHRTGNSKVTLLVAFTAGVAEVGMGQTMSLVANNFVPTHGSDIATFERNVRHFTFDLTGRTGAADWTGSELSLDVVNPALGRIWHASDQRIAYRDPTPTDPNNGDQCYVHNLAVPGLVRNAQNNGDTLMYDTFITRPGNNFLLDPAFASPGVPPTPEEPCPVPIVSTATRLRGLNPQGTEIPLAWFDAVNIPLTGSIIGRLTFEIEPSAMPHPGFLAVNPSEPGSVLFAVMIGRISASAGPGENPQRFEIWWVPEPATLPLMLIGGMACVARRR